MAEPGIPPGINVFGPDGNCTLAICPVEYSIYGYRPSLAASVALIVFYAIAALIHLYLGVRWKRWAFTSCMLVGSVVAILGYVGRIIMWHNPFNFSGFMLQIICITCCPVFFTAAIYVTLAEAINYFSPTLSRFSPRLFYWIFIPTDVVCLVFQAAGGALSTVSSGSSTTGVDLALAGLSLQVAALVVFSALFGDYLWRYARSSSSSSLSSSSAASKPGVVADGVADAPPVVARFTPRVKVFFAFLVLAVLLILTRCAYRVAELHQGYSGAIIRKQGLFIGLEGVMVVTAVYCLMFGHPGLVFKQNHPRKLSLDEETLQQKS